LAITFESQPLDGRSKAVKQGSATFPQSQAKNKISKVRRAVLIFHQQFHSLCCLWCCWNLGIYGIL